MLFFFNTINIRKYQLFANNERSFRQSLKEPRLADTIHDQIHILFIYFEREREREETKPTAGCIIYFKK